MTVQASWGTFLHRDAFRGWCSLRRSRRGEALYPSDPVWQMRPCQGQPWAARTCAARARFGRRRAQAPDLCSPWRHWQGWVSCPGPTWPTEALAGLGLRSRSCRARGGLGVGAQAQDLHGWKRCWQGPGSGPGPGRPEGALGVWQAWDLCGWKRPWSGQSSGQRS